MGAIRSKVCAKGHAFDAVGKDGRQRCLTCERDRLKAWRKAHRKKSKIMLDTHYALQ